MEYLFVFHFDKFINNKVRHWIFYVAIIYLLIMLSI